MVNTVQIVTLLCGAESVKTLESSNLLEIKVGIRFAQKEHNLLKEKEHVNKETH